jgi:hypothetical protein
VRLRFERAEYEFAWLIYDSEDVLQALVWDSVYHVFQVLFFFESPLSL